ncbi:MAG: glycosyltransferase [Bacteroidota bacterium]|nr:glycosyltransferase [Bacteroidota bacterium]
MPERQKTALIAPLNWGLGHASRMIPVIRALQNSGYEVTVAACSPADEMVRQEFPGLRIVPIKSYNIRYSRHRMLMLKLFAQAPGLLWELLYERKWIKQYVETEKPDVIISDNRFGLFHSRVKSCYITHQVNVIMPHYLKMFQPLIRYIHRQLIKKYDTCLIPDFSGTGGLSGQLAHSDSHFNFHHQYLGSLSGFLELPPKPSDVVPDVLAVISGPEPQRSLFIHKLRHVFSDDNRQIWLIAGQPEITYDHTDKNVRVISHLKRAELKYLMQHVPVLITRSGYTTLMDLFEIKRKAILIPTPGQTEQEYLATYFQQSFEFTTIPQHKMKSALQFQPHVCGKWQHNGSQKLNDICRLISQS